MQWLFFYEWWSNRTYHNATKKTPYKVVSGQKPPLVVSFIPSTSMVHVVDSMLQDPSSILHFLFEEYYGTNLQVQTTLPKMDVEGSIWIYPK